MNTAEIRLAIKKAINVYVWVNLTENDGCYVKVTKNNLLLNIPDVTEEPSYLADMREDGNLYIN